MTCDNRDYYGGEIETINIQEQLHAELLSMGLGYDEALNMTTAVKYLRRAGKKNGETFIEDVHKAATYLFRAIHEQWPDKGRIGGTD